ncbi:MAG: TonB-dependent receptor [Bacteroidales bacterium]|nr:TonB-dependent receptor [Bacteroidales bacterium]
MNFVRLFIFHFSLLIGLSCFAQKSLSDTTYHLTEVVVTANRLENFSAGSKIQNIDSITISQYKTGNLSSLLENESPLFIKSYGMGSLATSSFRGGSANHTAILWNGFNLGSPMNGQLDLSLIPNGFMNSINIQFGGSSALWGSGAVGGTIHLSNNVKFNNGITISAGTSFGSFSDFGQNILVEISKPKWVTSLKLSNTFAKNNFEYYNTQVYDSPKQKQNNAELKHHELLFENYFRINSRQKINFRFWCQYSDRNIPPTMLQTISKANQKDKNYRITSEWQRMGKNVLWFARAAYFDENIAYSDYTYENPALSRSQTFFTEVESKIILHKNHFLNIGVNNNFTQAISDGYPDKPHQNKASLFISYRFNSNNNKFSTTLSGREEISGNTLSPFTFSFGSEYIFLKWLSAKCNVARVYRSPTYNDLYWVPGGNPNLLPESGFSEEIGLLVKLISKNERINFLFEPTIFNRNMNNWILWLPGQSYWSPQNIMEVWSRGSETRSELGFQIKKVKLKIGLITNYVVSTNQKAKTDNDAALGKQLIYVPMYSGHGKFSVEYKDFFLCFNQSYTGYRYTSTDNTEYLKPYWNSNLYLSYKITVKKITFSLFAAVYNIFNEQYQVILNRAMPLRNYQTGISIQFNKPNINN